MKKRAYNNIDHLKDQLKAVENAKADSWKEEVAYLQQQIDIQESLLGV